MFPHNVFTARKRSLRRLCFYRCLSVHTRGGMHGFIWGVHGFIWGACVVLFGGHVWFYFGGMRGFIWGVCMVLFGGHAWFYLGGMHGFIWGHAWFYSGGVCVVLFGGHAWFYLGGMRGFIWGACVVLFGGHAWFYSGGHAWFYSGGVCVVFSVFSDTMRYGQWAGGTHPTGMHSCFALFLSAEPLIFLTYFNVMCEQYHRHSFNPFLNSEKNGAKNVVRKPD